MKKYKIEITETLQRVEEVEGDDEVEAFDKIREQYKQQKIVLDSEDFIGVEFDNYNLLPTVFTITKEEVSLYFEELKTIGKIGKCKKITEEEIKKILDFVECDELLAKDIGCSVKNAIGNVLNL